MASKKFSPTKTSSEAYASSTQYRHGMNAVAKVEPTNINQLPD